MQPFFTVACIGCKNTRLIIIIEDGFIKAGDNLDEDVLIDVNDNHNNKYNMSAIVRMISKLLKNTYKIIVLGSVVLLQLKWRYLTLRNFSPYYESQMKNVTKYKSFSFVTDMRNSPFSPLQTIFSWEPALWTLMSVAWVWWMMMSKKLIVIFTFKQVQVKHDAIDLVNGLGDVSMMLRLVPNDALHSEMTLF